MLWLWRWHGKDDGYCGLAAPPLNENLCVHTTMKEQLNGSPK
jgi:hypothetical protein